MADYKNQIPVEKMVAAVVGTQGKLGAIAFRCGCNVSTVERYIKKFPEVALAVYEESVKTGDVVENQLMKKIMAGHAASIIFYCKTKLKDRGYIEKWQETDKDEDASKFAADARKWYRALKDSVPKPEDIEEESG